MMPFSFLEIHLEIKKKKHEKRETIIPRHYCVSGRQIGQTYTKFAIKPLTPYMNVYAKFELNPSKTI